MQRLIQTPPQAGGFTPTASVLVSAHVCAQRTSLSTRSAEDRVVSMMARWSGPQTLATQVSLAWTSQPTLLFKAALTAVTRPALMSAQTGGHTATALAMQVAESKN